MKRVNILLIIVLLIVTVESRGQRQIVNDDVITVDVRKNYSSKKELILQDFMDVEYIALETNDDFVNQGIVEDIGKKFILVKNQNQINDGDIFVYDRTGKVIRKINHKGQSGREYTAIMSITLDEDNNEMFVNDHITKRILVYDLFGIFKRSFKHIEGKPLDLGGNPYNLFFTDIFNYDNDNLICYSRYSNELGCVIISKQDGSITKEITIPFKEKKTLYQRSQIKREGNNEKGTALSVFYGPFSPIIPYDGKWILLEFSSDTVYKLLPDNSLSPFMLRTPSVQSMNPEVMLILRLIADRYYFFETVKNEYDFSAGKGFPRTWFMYDKQDKAFSNYTIYNGDFSTKKEIYTVGFYPVSPINHDIESWYPLQAYQLVESYKKGELKDGKLKEIAAKLDEEDNPVIMLVKHKKL